MKQAIRPAISFILIALSALGMLNVYGDSPEAEALARKVACTDCDAAELQLTQLSRSPISQTFHFQAAGSAVKVIECQKSALFLGDYTCKEK